MDSESIDLYITENKNEETKENTQRKGRPKGSKKKKIIIVEPPKLELPNINEESLEDIEDIPPEEDSEEEEEEEEEQDSMVDKVKNMFSIDDRERLKTIALRNPEILTDKLDCNVLKRINKMSDDEVKERLFYAERKHSSDFDKKIAESTLSLVNNGVGLILQCKNELDEETKNNAELNKLVLSELSCILDIMPSKLKFGLVYGSSVLKARDRAKKNRLIPKEE